MTTLENSVGECAYGHKGHCRTTGDLIIKISTTKKYAKIGLTHRKRQFVNMAG